MTHTPRNLVTSFCLIALVGCGSQQTATTIRACNVLDLSAARTAIGSSAELPGGDVEEQTCQYVNPGIATLTIQIGTAQLYDQVTILQPHTATPIGDRARYNVQASGAVALQFVKGDYSATISINPIGSSPPDYLNAVLAAGQTAASMLP